MRRFRHGWRWVGRLLYLYLLEVLPEEQACYFVASHSDRHKLTQLLDAEDAEILRTVTSGSVRKLLEHKNFSVGLWQQTTRVKKWNIIRK